MAETARGARPWGEPTIRRRSIAAVLAAILALSTAACSGSSSAPGSGQPRPFPTIALQQPPGGGIGLQPPALGGGPAQPGGFGGGPVAQPNAGGLPSWVQPGVRLSWYAAAASVAQSRYAWVEDPNGEWEVPSTGKRYRRTDESGEGVGGGSGDGISQIDVIAVEGADVVLASNLYTIDRTQAAQSFILGPIVGAKVPGTVVDGAWMHPALLQQYLSQQAAGILVLRGPYALNGRQYSAVSFVSNSGSAYTSYTYDAETGILLSATTSTAGATSPIAAPGENPPVGNSQLTITRFLGMRQRQVPGTGSAVPAFAARGGQLNYGGTYFWTNPVDPSSGAFQYPMTYQVQLSPGGGSWMAYRAQSVVQGFLGAQPEQTGVATGNGGGFWYDPGALAAMQQGQVLDQDPVTGEQAVVSAAQGNVIAIDNQIPGIGQRRQYDVRSGALVVYDLQTPASGIALHLELQGNP
jgi:hypothetical protein